MNWTEKFGRIFGSLEIKSKGKLDFGKGKQTDWGTIPNPICNLGDHNSLCNF
jgi:hypothetical protein